jgi:hypothetical protein
VTAAFGKPSSRFSTRSALELRYGSWTIHFKRRRSDGKLLADAARSVDQGLYGLRGRRILAPWFGTKAIESAVASEVAYVPNGDFNEWFPRDGGFQNGDFPRRITWGIDSRGRRWLRLATDLDVEFRG